MEKVPVEVVLANTSNGSVTITAIFFGDNVDGVQCVLFSLSARIIFKVLSMILMLMINVS